MNSITLDRCCIHTITTKSWSLPEAVEHYAAAGVKGISVWQNATEGIGPRHAGEIIRQAGLEIVSYVRGGFFPNVSSAGRAQAIDHNKKLLEEAAALGAPMIVLVCGASPDQSLEKSREHPSVSNSGSKWIIVGDGFLDDVFFEDRPYENQEIGLSWAVKIATAPAKKLFDDEGGAVNVIKASKNPKDSNVYSI